MGRTAESSGYSMLANKHWFPVEKHFTLTEFILLSVDSLDRLPAAGIATYTADPRDKRLLRHSDNHFNPHITNEELRYHIFISFHRQISQLQ